MKTEVYSEERGSLVRAGGGGGGWRITVKTEASNQDGGI